LSKKAQHDLELIRDYISRDDPAAAQDVRLALLATADLLAQNVEAGTLVRNAPPRHADVRWFVAPQFRNYLIFYRPFRDSILVVRILHAKQDWTRFFGGSERGSGS
ncbi:MAG: type II toxin-antitoxin system RelE/ParE family toxin, partial [Limisphaerales bacterium]